MNRRTKLMQLYYWVIQNPDKLQSIFKINCEQNSDYHRTYDRIRNLERKAFFQVASRPGVPAKITISQYPLGI